jgi:hypothetical protein
MKWIVVVLAVLAVLFLQTRREEVGVKRGNDGLYYKIGESNVYTGEGLVYHPNGSKAQQGQIIDGKATGPWKQWHSNGQIHWEGSYKDGNRDGVWVQYDEEGGKIEETSWLDGLKVVSTNSVETKQNPEVPSSTKTTEEVQK